MYGRGQARGRGGGGAGRGGGGHRDDRAGRGRHGGHDSSSSGGGGGGRGRGRGPVRSMDWLALAQALGAESCDPLDLLHCLGRTIGPLALEQYQAFLAAAFLALENSESDSSVRGVLMAVASAKVGERQQYGRDHLGQIFTSFEHAQEGSPAALKLFATLLLPALRVLSHEALRDSVHSALVNPLLAFTAQRLSLKRLAAQYERFARGQDDPLPAPYGYNAATNKMGPSRWLDVVEPASVLLLELLTRFQGQQDFVQLVGGAEPLLVALQALSSARLSGREQECDRVSWRRLQDTLSAVQHLLGFGQQRQGELLSWEEQSKQKAELGKRLEARKVELLMSGRCGPDSLPGDLRPDGPRHDNDQEDYSLIRVVPTAEELLCSIEPYLPPNRPASIPHTYAVSPQRAHLETHFRLFRHDAVQPLAEVLQALQSKGGVGAAQASLAEQVRRGQGSGRVDLGRNAQLFAYRNVACMGVETSRHEGLYLMLAFDPPPDLMPASAGKKAAGGSRQKVKKAKDAEEFWKNSKRLMTGTLACLAWEQDSSRGPAGMQLVVGVVADRDTRKLAPFKGRPSIGIRLLQGGDMRRLIEQFAWGAFKGAGAAAGADTPSWQPPTPTAQQEVLLLHDSNSFFAYEAILRALQGMRSIPLAPLIVPALPPADSQPSVALSTARGGQLTPLPIDLPAYLANGPVMDLTCLIDAAKLAALPEAERTRVRASLGRSNLTAQEPCVVDLLAATSLDRAQAVALLAMLTQQLANVQGPPGTGKTYLGVQFVLALLANTTNNAAGRPAAAGRAGFGVLRQPDPGAWVPGARPDIGPLLVVCFTNHALDSFLEALLDAGVKAEHLVRVGGRSKSTRLELCNLANRAPKAGGAAVGALLQTGKRLQEQVEQCSAALQGALSSDGRPMLWEELQELLLEEVMQPGNGRAWRSSFLQGFRPWNQRYQEVDEEGFIMAKQKGSNTDLVKDWLRGDLPGDWANGRINLPNVPKPQKNGPKPAAPPALRALAQSERPLATLQTTRDVWLLSRSERQRLYRFFHQHRSQHLCSRLDDLQRQITDNAQELRAEFDAASLKGMTSARVVGMTTSGVARYQNLVAAMKTKVVLVEEAAEVFEAHVLSSLSRSVEHLVLVGDHEQLRPKPNVYALQAVSHRGLDLDVSLLERLATHPVPAPAPSTTAPLTGGHLFHRFPVSSLSEQRRMRPCISALIRAPIYPHLTDHPRTLEYPHVKGMVHDLWFWEDDFPEGGAGGDDGRSKFNPEQARRAVMLMRYCVQQGYAPDDVVILVPYVGQLFQVKRCLEACRMQVVLSDRDADELQAAGYEEVPEGDSAAEAGEAAAAGARGGSASALPPGSRVVDVAKSIRVATIDNFQGEEAKIIILTLTRNNPGGNIGFMKMQNRINVMLSRAQHGMYLLGNVKTLQANTEKAPMWPQVLDILQSQGLVGSELQLKCENHGHVTPLSNTDDFELLVGDGGCQRSCEEVLPCGHGCPRRCHIDDPGHALVRCIKPCDRLHSACGHACPKRCHEECGQCRVLLQEPFQLPCGHSVSRLECWRSLEPESIQCNEVVLVEVPGCGHRIQIHCHMREEVLRDPTLCTAPVEVQRLVCGHRAKVPCGSSQKVLEEQFKCKEPCGQLLPSCQDPCTAACGGCIRLSVNQQAAVLMDAYAAAHNLGPAWQEAVQAVQDRQEGQAVQRVVEERDVTWRRLLEQPGGAVPAGAWLQYLAWLKTQLQQQRQLHIHPPCRKTCGKALACSHNCAQSCHQGRACPPCVAPCVVACSHHCCKLKCGEPCIPCAEKCGWRGCGHGRPACSAPCGAPCDRLPCDKRCEKKLQCGHRCPGVCGEDCAPLARFCVDASCMEQAPQEVKDMRVDHLMLRDFGELRSEDIDDDPLLLLGCGHAFQMSTLDGMLELEQYYERDARADTWTAPKTLPPDLAGKAACPQCRAPIGFGLRRYGRAVKKVALDLIDRKHMAHMGTELQRVQQRLKDLQAQAQADTNNTKGGEQLLLKGALACAADFRRLCLVKSPKSRIYEAVLARQQKEQQQDGAEASSAAASTTRTGEGDNGASTSAPPPPPPPPPPSLSLISAAAAQAARVHAAKTSLASLSPNIQLLCDARLGLLDAASLQLTLSAASVGVLLFPPWRAAEKELATLSKEAGTWFQQAVATETFNKAFHLCRCHVELLLHAVKVMCMHKAKLAALPSTGPGGKELGAGGPGGKDASAGGGVAAFKDRQLELLQQAERVAAEAEQVWAQGRSGSGQIHVEAVRQLVKEIPSLVKRVKGEDVTAMQVLSALSAAEGYSGDPTSFLQGHLYRCPRGHLYVIGNCGQAMQTSTCPECGATIGGQSHRLQSDNASAAGALDGLRTLQL